MAEYVAESGHWYDRNGRPVYEVPNKSKGGMRPTRITDARKSRLVPSVTGVIGILDKPALTNWKVNQVIEACIQEPYAPGTDPQTYESYIRDKALGADATGVDRGTEIHAAIELYFSGRKDHRFVIEYWEWVDAIVNKLAEHYPNLDPDGWVAEDSFASQLGYGGKIDLYHPDGVIADIKTKDFSKTKPKAYDEHGMQLVAYSHGVFPGRAMSEIVHVNIFVDRNNPEVLGYEWETEDLARAWGLFVCCLETWKLLKKYDSSFGRGDSDD